MLIKEYISFERGKDPKEVLGIGYHKVMDLKKYDIIIFINKFQGMFKGDVGVIINTKYTKNTIKINFYPFSNIKPAKNARPFMIKNDSSYHSSTITKSIKEWMELIDVERYGDTNESLLEFERGLDPKTQLGIGVPKKEETIDVAVILFGDPYVDKKLSKQILTQNIDRHDHSDEYTHDQIQKLIDENCDINIDIQLKIKTIYFHGRLYGDYGNAYYTIKFLKDIKHYKWAKYENEYYTL